MDICRYISIDQIGSPTKALTLLNYITGISDQQSPGLIFASALGLLATSEGLWKARDAFGWLSLGNSMKPKPDPEPSSHLPKERIAMSSRFGSVQKLGTPGCPSILLQPSPRRPKTRPMFAPRATLCCFNRTKVNGFVCAGNSGKQNPLVAKGKEHKPYPLRVTQQNKTDTRPP